MTSSAIAAWRCPPTTPAPFGSGPGADRRGAGVARRGRRGHGAHPRPGLRRAESAAPQAGHAADADTAGRHQPSDLRGVRRLRRREQLSLRAVDRHAAGGEDHDRPDHVQSRLLLPRRRLPELHDRRAGRRHRAGRRAGAADRPAGSGGAGRPDTRRRPYRRYRRDRRRDRRADPHDGRDARRVRQPRVGSDGAVAEGRTGRQRPPALDGPRTRFKPAGRRHRRRAAGVRSGDGGDSGGPCSPVARSTPSSSGRRARPRPVR